MARQLIADKKERSLGELTIIVLLVASMMATFIHYFFKQEEQLTHAGFSALANTFSAKVTLVHAQWYMDNKPNVVIVNMMDGTQQHVSVNNKGWIDSVDETFVCHDIWKIILATPLLFMKSPVSVVEVKREMQQQGHICQYGLPGGFYFEYNSINGSISDVMKRVNVN